MHINFCYWLKSDQVDIFLSRPHNHLRIVLGVGREGRMPRYLPCTTILMLGSISLVSRLSGGGGIYEARK